MLLDRISFRSRFFIVIAAVALISVIISTIVNNYFLQRVMLEKNEESVRLLLKFIINENGILDKDYLTNSTCKRFLDEGSIVRIELLDEKYNPVVACRDAVRDKLASEVARPDLQDVTDLTTRITSDRIIYLRRVDYKDGDNVFRDGLLMVTADKGHLFKSERGIYKFRLFYIFMSIALLIIFTYFVSGYLTRPFSELVDSIESVSDGRSERITIGRGACVELGVAVDKLNKLMRSLSTRGGYLSSSEERFQTLLERTEDIILFLDVDFNILYATPSFERITGFSLDKVGRDLSLYDLVADESSPLLSELSSKIKSGESIKDVELALLRRGMGDIYLLTSWIVRDGREYPDSGIILFAKDITERKMIEYELKKKSENMETILFSLSHDLKSPVFTLKGMSMLFKHKYYDNLDEQGRHFIDRINENILRMERLISHMLDISRAEKQIFKNEEVSLSQVISLLLSDLQEIIKDADAEISVDTALPVILGDRDKIYIVFKNLIENSLKYRSPERRLKISISKQISSDGVDIIFEDNGIGIESRYIDRVFRPFSRAVSDDMVGGDGIGLAIVKGILDAHNAVITVESSYREWTRFKIRFAGQSFV